MGELPACSAINDREAQVKMLPPTRIASDGLNV
jgi:hypothetical protein